MLLVEFYYLKDNFSYLTRISIIHDIYRAKRYLITDWLRDMEYQMQLVI